MSRYSEYDLAERLAHNPDIRLSRQNSANRGDLRRPKSGNPTVQILSQDKPEPVKRLNGAGSSGQTRRKYRNQPCVIDNIRFDSKKESARWLELKMLERAGEIKDLKRQRTFDLSINGVKICAYRCDFEYFELDQATSVWTWIVEDVKSAATRKLASYRHKKKLMKALWTVEIRET